MQKPVLFSDLIAETKDGEWGEGQEAPGHVLCDVIRGTDFADLHTPGIELPQRWIPEHLVARKALIASDILIETAGGTAKQSTGRTALMTKEFLDSRGGRPVLCSSFARHLRVDRVKVHSVYLYYVLQALYTSGYMGVFNLQHTGVARFQFTAFRTKTRLTLHDSAAQPKIAATLRSYDDLIANNQRRIALLECMAEESYREWFVRMRFPQHATLKGDELTPPGWSRQPIGDLAALIKRGISPDYAEQSEHQVINQKCIRGGRVSMAEARPHVSVVPDDKLLRFGDVLINSTGVGTLGRAAVFDIEADGVTCDSHVTILRPTDVALSGEFLAYTIQLLQPYFESMASGSTGQAELSRELISRTKVLVPTSDLMKRFSDAAAPIRRQRRLLLDQNEKLSAMRDRLLPRLISGKLRVDALDIQFPPSMQEPPAEAAQRGEAIAR
ncbi:hypothetical protein [Aquincola sp. J276]|uniref:hypothetical protein n=1 Tax=Aquincola sp. J276 TaxID=2898432 RepID=UPI002151C2D0|nr:hypothetical protein [Aquincola sp. J276]MCR5868213.1 hypothetical protein [Aquincola sp. J276]